MMKKEALERQSTSYLKKLENWELIRWKRRLELLNETTYDLWLIKEVLKDRSDAGLIIKFLRDEDTGITTRDIVYSTGTHIK